MASIPNLNTLRTSRGGPRVRGRQGASTISDGLETSSAPAQDRIVQQTDNDASSSRLSAVELGYLHDDYAKSFSRSNEPPPRRYPLINRGTYVRTIAIDRLVSSFVKTVSGRKQIVSLGAGSDTRFFRLEGVDVIYHELDFAVNIAEKRCAIERSPHLQSQQRALEEAGCVYYLHPIDLRDLKPGSSTKLDGLQSDLPTLILSECCLCYLAPEEASAVIAYFMQQLNSSAAMIVYEPIRPTDAFGRTMVSNLASRGIHMQTLKQYASLEAQRQRFKLAGLSTVQGARDVFQIWKSDDWISESERERIERREWLDEVEEWNLLASHYCIAWACRGDDISSAWAGIHGDATSAEIERDS